MLTQLTIAGYRGFRSYSMEGLTRVNLLVGRNNSGKTALLEGIQFLTSGGDPAALAEAADRRGEVIFPRVDTPRPILADIAHFCHGHAAAAGAKFELAGDNGYPAISAEIRAAGKKNGEALRPDRASSSGYNLVITKEGHDPRERKLPISREGGMDFDGPGRGRRMGIRAMGQQASFVGSDSLNALDMAAMWDDIVVSGKEPDIAGAMRVLEPDLESVHFLTGVLASGYFPSRSGIVVGIKGQELRVPLGSMGDGMRRMMALATALAFTKGSCLFVDEIDTGLHYTVMSDMWRLVVSRAIAADTQVFATTHSWDCIEGLARLSDECPDLACHFSIHKIDRDVPHSVGFEGESIVRMAKSDIDPR